MYEMHYFSYKFLKIVKRGAHRPQRSLIFDFGFLKLRDLAKLCFLKLIMSKSNFRKISYNVISVTSSFLRHRKTSSNYFETTRSQGHKIFLFWDPPNQNFWLRQWEIITAIYGGMSLRSSSAPVPRLIL